MIVANAVTLGLETSARAAGPLLHVADRPTLAVFVVELALRWYAAGRRFFRDPWNVFDFVVVGVSLVPAAGPLAVLRTLRVLRVLRLVSAVPSMRRVVSGLLVAVPGMASVAALLSAPLAWISFVVYLLVSSFAVLNLFIAVVVSGMETQVTNDLAEAEDRHAASQASSDAEMLVQVRALRAEVAELRAERDRGAG